MAECARTRNGGGIHIRRFCPRQIIFRPSQINGYASCVDAAYHQPRVGPICQQLASPGVTLELTKKKEDVVGKSFIPYE